ncbi:phenylacetate--CoA ligase family protein [Acinetobacter baumannii]|uniref:phenylacetate--CoA ligase family protein n=1 Tax=Acinetobacter baumannii TaxID=470 RepID=UPI000DE5CC9F|nr:phenylacetate--CoA ligase family protein [Acinetobacter baumannii]MDC5067774.1 phenylacetate--CoA ligase family protein [Acinetobacter baumannii]SSI84084.1 phenylacetate-coenzyme A ligase [Acinetobacter baumannii]SSO29978.1 phenylacetate-coenzyme A ligase [Acinetobacter baumannii]SSP08224.1 phenylacetate-coenzyme A ligase [Acinetobacter baumannii]
MSYKNKLYIYSKALVRKDYLSTSKFLEKSAYWSESEIKLYQEEAISKIIQYAINNVPFYKQLIEKRELIISETQGINQLKTFPIITKEIISKNRDNFIVQESKLKRVNGSTGGSTGIPLKYVMSKENALYSSLLLDRGLGLAGYRAGDRLAIIAGGSLVGLKKPLRKRIVERLANVRYYSSYGMDDKQLELYSKDIIDFQPKFLRGYASALNALATYMRTNGLTSKLKISAIFSTSEVLVKNVRDNIEDAFGCEVYDGWGLNDGGATAFECHEHLGMHIDPERAYVEIVEDETTREFGEGVGRIIITNLIDKVMPFIRYDSGDIGRIDFSECPCGKNTPRLFVNYGRVTDTLVIAGKIIGVPVLTVLMGKVPVLQYQIAKTGDSQMTFRIIKSPEYNQTSEDYIRRSILERIGEVDLIFNYVNSITPPQGRKHKFLVDETLSNIV